MCATSLLSFFFQSGRFAPGEEHRDALLVLAVLVTKLLGQIALFEEDANEDVGGGDGCEQEMADRHHRRSPECDDEAEIEWVPYEFVIQRRAELRLRQLTPGQIGSDLTQSEQFEMV